MGKTTPKQSLLKGPHHYVQVLSTLTVKRKPSMFSQHCRIFSKEAPEFFDRIEAEEFTFNHHTKNWKTLWVVNRYHDSKSLLWEQFATAKGLKMLFSWGQQASESVRIVKYYGSCKHATALLVWRVPLERVCYCGHACRFQSPRFGVGKRGSPQFVLICSDLPVFCWFVLVCDPCFQ